VSSHPDTEVLIRQALESDANRAPIGSRSWAGPSYSTTTAVARRHKVWMYGSLAVAATLAIGVIATYRMDRGTENQAAGFQPSGTEYPLTDLGEPTDGAFELTLASLSGMTQVPGQPPIASGPAITYQGGATAELMYCESSGGGGGCSPEWMATVPNIGITSSVDNRVADFDVWIWANVPANAASVQFTQGDVELWQRPIRGMVQFPYSWLTHDPAPDATDQVDYTALPYNAIAYDINGVKVGEANQAAIDLANSQVVPPLNLYADITSAQGETISALTDSTLRECLRRAGATFSPDGTVATLPDGADDQTVWKTCVGETKAAVAAAIAAINPRFYDGLKGERPLVADPMFKWGP
jgi:hypothetical protein